MHEYTQLCIGKQHIIIICTPQVVASIRCKSANSGAMHISTTVNMIIILFYSIANNIGVDQKVINSTCFPIKGTSTIIPLVLILALFSIAILMLIAVVVAIFLGYKLFKTHKKTTR